MAAKYRTRKPAASSGFLLTALAAAVTAVTGGAGSIAYAQEGADLEEITVTGSRIRQTSGFTTPLPVTSMTTDELFDFSPGSAVAEQLDALPQFFGNTSLEGVGTGLTSVSGSTSLDLRNLSGNRTLVLFDGYRVVPSSKEGTVNVDFFPTALVRSVDVVTGGASAAYGADAVGGVTNFVVDREFEGLTTSASTGVNEFGDGERWSFSIAGGTQIGDRLNIIGSIEARELGGFSRESHEVEKQQRIGWIGNPNWTEGGSEPRRITMPNVATTANSVYGLINNTGTPLDGYRFNKEGTEIVPFNTGDISSGFTQSFSGGPDAELYDRAFGGGIGATEAESRSAFLGLQYQLTDSLTVFGQFIGGRTIASDILERGGIILYSIWAPTVYRDNAYLPDSVAEIMDENGLSSFSLQKNGTLFGEPELGLGGKDSKTFTTRSYSAGFEWDLPFRDWHVRGVYQTGETERRNVFASRWRMDRAFLAMDAVRDPDSGAIVCRVQLFNPTEAELAASPAVQGRISSRSDPSAVNPGDPGAIPLRSPIGLDNTVRDCVPYNVMGTGNISQEALDYTFGPSPKIGEGYVDQDFAELLLNGELFEGWGYGPISFAAGLTWRDQSFWDETHPANVDELGPPLNDPNLGIQGIPRGYFGGSANLHYISTLPRLSGDASVWEYFGELNVPVWEGAVGSQEQSLSVDMAFRESDYDRSGTAQSWKVGVDYQILNDVRLRFTQSTDVREPTFSELFDAQGTNGSIRDPRFGDTEQQITVINGGNPNLAPEEADTVTAGIVFAPGWLDGFQLSLDWYDITLEGAVATLGEQRIVEECFLRNVESQCAQIETEAGSGAVTKVFDTFQNVAQATVEGVDMEVAYRFEPNFFGNQIESFTVRGLAGYVKERTDTPAGGTPTDRSGTLSNPDLTGILTANYSVGPYSFQMQGRYQDSTTQNGTWVEGVDVDDNSIPSIAWWNARIGYEGETSTGSTWRVGFNIQNVFDKEPVVVPSVNTRFAIQGLTGDTYGRRYNLNLNYTF